MSKTSLLIGCVLAAALHGLLLWPLSPAERDEVRPDEAPPRTKLAVAPPPAPAPPKPKPVPRPPEPPKTGKASPEPKPPLQEVAPAPAQPKPDKADPADASAGDDDKALPPMRIVWSSPSLSSPYASAAAVGSLMMRSTSRPAI